jgi:TolB-like protein/Flp pilus assembly protein TadD
MAQDVFISHSSHDKVYADGICAKLESRGIRCWRAPRDIRPGMEWGAAIVEAIDGARMMLLVFSSNANNSPQISREVERAVHKGVIVIPVRVEDVMPSGNLEYFLGTPHWLDAFTSPFEQHLDYIADSTKYWLERPVNDPAAVVLPHVEPRITQRVDSIRAETATVAIPAKPKARSNRAIALGAGAVLLVLIAIAAGVKLLTPSAQPRATPGIDRSLAVLPLENFSGDPNQEYFADGMTDELITELANIGGLTVISRTSVMQYKGERKETLPAIARALNVGKVVEGSVMRSGDKVRITVQLIDAPTDKHIWAKSYESESKDVLKLQATLASEIASQIKVELTPEERTRLADVQSVNPEAHEAYLKGLYYIDQADPNARVSAQNFFERAVELDPKFAPAYAGLTSVYSFGAFVGPGSEMAALARAAAQKAVELDDNLAEAHSALAVVKYQYDYDWAGSEREFRRAVELNPSSAIAPPNFGLSLALQGRFDEGEAEIERGNRLDPYSVGNSILLAYVATLRGNFEAARERCRKTGDLNPGLFVVHFGLGLIDVEAGKFKDAIPEFLSASAIQNPNFATGFLGYAYAAAGQRDNAQKTLAQLTALSTKEYVSPFAVAQIYLGLGDRDQALEWLQKAYKAHSPWMLTVGVSRIFDPVRGDPRFTALVHKLGLHERPSDAHSAALPTNP